MVPTTRFRKTWITFDTFSPMILQPLYVFMKRAPEMAKGPCPDRVNVVLVDKEWQLDSYHFHPGNSLLSAGQDGWWMNAVTMAPYHIVENTQRQSGLLDVTYYGTATTGAPMAQKRIPAGISFLQALVSDQAAFAAPEPEDDPTDMDRVLLTNANHDPKKPLFFVFRIPAGVLQGFGTAVTAYFGGPAGSDCDSDGLGQYALKIAGDGRARLFEKVVDLPATAPGAGIPARTHWKRRMNLTLFDAVASSSATILFLTINNDLRLDSQGKYHGNRLSFVATGISRPGFLLIEALIGLAISAIKAQQGSLPITYYAPQVRTKAPVLDKARIDVRRDVRAKFALGTHLYKTTGHITDDPFVMPFYPDDSKPIRIEYYAKVPTGCTLVVRLYDDADGSEITGTTILVDELGGIKEFDPVPGHNKYHVRFDFTGDGTDTPKLSGYRVFRDPVSSTPDIATTEVPYRSSSTALPAIVLTGEVRITGNEGDPRKDSMEFIVDDLMNIIPMLRSRGNIPFKVEIEYDEEGTRTTLFQGYTKSIKGLRIGRNPNRVYPDNEFTSYMIQGVGEWRRLVELHVPKRQLFWDKDVDAPSKVTDMIRSLLLSLGYDAGRIDIPDLEIRLFSESEEDYIVEPGSTVAEFIIRLAMDYLGAFFIWDEAAGTDGQWRIIEPKQAPFNNLAKFYIFHPGTGILPHISDAYGEPDIMPNNQRVIHTFLKAGSVEYETEELEGNMVIVHGLAGEASAAKQGGRDNLQLTAIAVNHNSFNFRNLPSDHPNFPDTTHPDWVGRMIPIEVWDASLTTQAAVNWVCRRIFDYSAHNRNMISCLAPLILVTDVTDTQQQRPRKLRFGDPVLIQQADGSFEQYLVADCTPMYSHDNFQFAHYRFVTSSNINTYGIP